ncbi:MAG: carboxy terminal-processing peptidase, partial [Bacteroidota bacterium]
ESKISSQEKRSETDDDKPKEIKTTAQLEIEARDDVKEKFDEWFKNMGKLKRSDRFEVYLNTFSHLFDPHSDYYNPKERQDFDIGMSGKLEGIGARLRSEGDLTMVASIVPGGPAWKQGDIEVNDYILSVTQQNEETVDIFGMRLDDVVSMIRGDKGTIVTLAIQKKDGTVIQVEIERDVVNIEDSFARSAIIDLEGKAENIGYIHLPKFYSSFEAPNEGNSCAVDVAEEIEKLKTNKVNGIILDLRNNGGGSLKDVVDMSGLFIEDGPIVQVKPRDRKAFVYKDDDAEVKYNGPLVVLINSFSASASEILAAAMQDYDRAIVVGTQSFGKGTVQRFIDLDRAVRGTSEHKPLGAVKVTMQKFYRIDGGSTQLRGVTPDIELPDRYSLIDVGEREYPYALDWTEIAGLEYNQDVFNIDAAQREYLKAQSSKRLSTNPDFQLIQEQAKWLKENREQTSYALNLDQFIAQVDEQEAEAEQFKGIMDEAIAEMSIKTLPEDEEAINFDETTKGRSENWVSVRSKDI